MEIHRQISGKKLFCDCDAIVNDPNKVDIKFSRKLRVSEGESGEIDIAAKEAVEKNLVYNYEGKSSSVCLVELDEEPPHEINKEALKIALHISLLLNAKINSIAQIMRKTVIDGSNTSGFQRTVMIAYDGYVETSKGRVRIDSIFLND